MGAESVVLQLWRGNSCTTLTMRKSEEAIMGPARKDGSAAQGFGMQQCDFWVESGIATRRTWFFPLANMAWMR
eukprot:6402863-Pyramimonas_sp.AAC.2